jgi:hypothetical protein
MADTRNLWFLGFILGAITAAVVLLAGAVVHAHVDGRLSLDDAYQPIVAAPAPTVER